MQSLMVSVITVLLVAQTARAETTDPSNFLLSARFSHESFGAAWPSCGDAASVDVPVRDLVFPSSLLRQDAQPIHAAAVEHSDAYQTRAKLHKYASVATLPLFAAELALGQSLYNTPGTTGGKKSAHAVVGAGIVGLFGVNTVTGAWNMFGEGRNDKDGRTLRLVHGLLMMAADVGMLATTASAPNSGPRGALTFQTNAATHRNLAVASIGVGTAGYLLMLFGNH
ncbi:MAG: hypothetical protein ACRD2I_20260 [Vicinamibacterales bacterium]